MYIELGSGVTWTWSRLAGLDVLRVELRRGGGLGAVEVEIIGIIGITIRKSSFDSVQGVFYERRGCRDYLFCVVFNYRAS